jgi:hypothetical protein
MSSVGWTGADVKTYTYAFGTAHLTPPARSDLNSLLAAPHRLPLLPALLRATPSLLPRRCSPSEVGAPTSVWAAPPVLPRLDPTPLPDSPRRPRRLLSAGLFTFAPARFLSSVSSIFRWPNDRWKLVKFLWPTEISSILIKKITFVSSWPTKGSVITIVMSANWPMKVS